jgi:hypothetical protein
MGEDNTYSQWSEEKLFEFDSTGIISVLSKEKMHSDRYYDLQGREVKNPTNGMYIHNGKKFMSK